MLRLTVEILLSFNFLASIAFDSSVKIVILALRADPSTIRKIELGFSLHLSGLKLTLRNKVRIVILNRIYQLLILSLSILRRCWLLRLISELLLLLSSLNDLFTVSESTRVALDQVFFLSILLLIRTLSFESSHIQIVFLELILKSAVLIQHHLELLDLL